MLRSFCFEYVYGGKAVFFIKNLLINYIEYVISLFSNQENYLLIQSNNSALIFSISRLTAS